MNSITLQPLQADDKEQFILDNQEAFRYGATEEFGLRDEHYEEDGEIISRATIEKAISEGDAYRIICNRVYRNIRNVSARRRTHYYQIVDIDIIYPACS